MPHVLHNVIANLLGKVWTILISLAVVPVYIHTLGMESYGLLGIFLSLTAIFAVLDLGLGNALNRQLAHYSVQLGREQDMSNLLRTLELIYWFIGIAIGVITSCLAPFIADYWVRPDQLTAEDVLHSIVLMGIAIAVLWPRALYVGGLMGIQRQVSQNVVSSLAATTLSVGGVLVVSFVSPTVQALIAWTIVVGLLETLAMRAVLLRRLPRAASPSSFSRRQLLTVWRFAAGMTGISILAVILGQLDKVILSKLLTLESFGYYSLAWRVVSGFYLLIAPVQSALFPRFSQLAALGDQEELARTYHRGSQMMSVIVLPIAAVLAAFPGELLELWTLNPVVAANTGSILAVLAAGTAINGLMSLPTSLQLSFGWTRLVFFTNVVAVALLAPAIYVASYRFGGLGAACIWLVLNAGYVVFMLPIMHRRLLVDHLGRWLLHDVGAPLAAVLVIVGGFRLLVDMPDSYGKMIAGIVAVSIAAALAAVFAAPEIRAALVQRLGSRAQTRSGS